MADPLSIAAGVLQLLQTTWTVAYELKKFHDNATVIGKTISDLKHDVEGLARVLESMRDTFESITAEHGSGHVGTLWTNVARSIEDGKGVLDQIQSQIREINKETKFLDEHRKQLRLNRSEPKMARFRGQIQSYKDSLQLSLQAIMLWNQMSYQKTADQVLPNLSDLHDDVRRIALDLNQRIEALQSMVSSQQDEIQVVAMQNLRDCVRSAASTISSATTIVASRGGTDQNLPSSSSDFGDVFPVQYNVAMRRWVESNTIYEYDEAASRAPPQSVADVPTLGESDNGSDSDVDLEDEMTRLLLDTGKQKLAAGDSKGGERMLRNCLRRVEITGANRAPEKTSIHLDVIVILHDLYLAQQKWSEAQKMLLQKMAIQERLLGKKDPGLLQDVMSLAKLQMQKGDLVEAQLHARRALKGYRKLQKPDDTKACLSLLIEICNADGNESDQEAYTVMLMGLKNGDDSATTPSSSKHIPFHASAETLLGQQRVDEDVSGDHGTTAPSETTDLPHVLAKSNSAINLALSPDLDGRDSETPSASDVEKEVKPLERQDDNILDQSLDAKNSSSTSLPDNNVSKVHGSELLSKASEPSKVSSAADTIGKTDDRRATPPTIVEPVAVRRFSFAQSDEPDEDLFSRSSIGHSEMSKLTDFESVATVSSQDEPTPLRGLTKAVSAPDIREASSASSPPSTLSGTSSQHGTWLTVPSGALLADDVKQADYGTPIIKENRKHSRNKSAPLLQPPTPNTTAPTTFDEMGLPPRQDTRHPRRRFSFESSVESIAGSEKLRPARSISVSKPKRGLFPPRIKVVVVGDSCVGKTSLLAVLSRRHFPEGSIMPTTIENDLTWVNVDSSVVELAIWDNSGLDDYSRLRVTSYTDAHVILICFAIDNPDTLDNVQEVWIAEVFHFCKGVPIFLVGTKADLRGDARTIEELLKTSQHPVTREEGEQCRKRIGANGYFECSARTNQGVAELFEAATRAALSTKIRKSQDKKKGIFSSLSFNLHKSRS